jgi:hypothetical protein
VLDPRAIALLGIGYAAGLVARIGLWDAPAGGGGGKGKPRRKVYPTFYDPRPVIEPLRRPVEEDEAILLLSGGL